MLGAVSLCIAVSFTSPSHIDTIHPLGFQGVLRKMFRFRIYTPHLCTRYISLYWVYSGAVSPFCRYQLDPTAHRKFSIKFTY